MKNKVVVQVALFLSLMGVVCGLSPLTVMAGSGTTNPMITLTNVPVGDAAGDTSGKIYFAVSAINQSLADDHGWTETMVNPTTGASYESPIEFIKYTYKENSGVRNVTLTINMRQYKKLNNQLQQDTMQVTLDGIYNSDISRTLKNKIYNEISALDATTAALVRQLSNDVTADFAGAYSWFKPFSGVIGWFLGVAALAMFAVLGVTMVIDIAFITLPIVQLALTKEKENKATFVSHEAFHAVKEQQSKAGTEYVSPMAVYLRSKTGQFIALFICLLYLVSGELYGLLASLIDYFRGVLG